PGDGMLHCGRRRGRGLSPSPSPACLPPPQGEGWGGGGFPPIGAVVELLSIETRPHRNPSPPNPSGPAQRAGRSFGPRGRAALTQTALTPLKGGAYGLRSPFVAIRDHRFSRRVTPFAPCSEESNGNPPCA